MNVLKTIERRVRRWRQRPAAAGPLPQSQRPVISISCMYGALGAEVAGAVARRLEFDLFDRQLVDRIAESAGVRQQVVASLDERQQDLISEYLAGLYLRDRFTGADYVEHLYRVLLTIGQHGRAVIVGRGSQFVLAPDRTLRVRAVAPRELRVRRIAERHGLSRDQAQAEVMRRDEERRELCWSRFERDVDDVLAYDLVVNTASCSSEQAAAVIRCAFEARFRGGGGPAR